jgi:hypothetical protein
MRRAISPDGERPDRANAKEDHQKSPDEADDCAPTLDRVGFGWRAEHRLAHRTRPSPPGKGKSRAVGLLAVRALEVKAMAQPDRRTWRTAEFGIEILARRRGNTNRLLALRAGHGHTDGPPVSLKVTPAVWAGE